MNTSFAGDHPDGPHFDASCYEKLVDYDLFVQMTGGSAVLDSTNKTAAGLRQFLVEKNPKTLGKFNWRLFQYQPSRLYRTRTFETILSNLTSSWSPDGECRQIVAGLRDLSAVLTAGDTPILDQLWPACLARDERRCKYVAPTLAAPYVVELVEDNGVAHVKRGPRLGVQPEMADISVFDTTIEPGHVFLSLPLVYTRGAMLPPVLFLLATKPTTVVLSIGRKDAGRTTDQQQQTKFGWVPGMLMAYQPQTMDVHKILDRKLGLRNFDSIDVRHGYVLPSDNVPINLAHSSVYQQYPEVENILAHTSFVEVELQQHDILAIAPGVFWGLRHAGQLTSGQVLVVEAFPSYGTEKCTDEEFAKHMADMHSMAPFIDSCYGNKLVRPCVRYISCLDFSHSSHV